MTLKTDQSIQIAADLIKAYGAVAIVGAGLSVEAGYPMIAQFSPLLRHALIEDTECRAALGADFDGLVEGAEDGLSQDRLKRAFASLAEFSIARQAFQRAFSLRDLEQIGRGSASHMVGLARLLHDRSVVMVISLNWDTQLEAAYESEYGRRLSPDGQWFAKPHGDARHPEHDWVLPYQPSHLDPDLIDSINKLAQAQPRVLLLVGYSEQDEEIASKIIEPLGDRWTVIRIGPGLLAPDIGATASEALPKLCAAVGADDQFPEWEYVQLGDSNGISHALSGRGMLAGDALECPRVPEVEIVANQLHTDRSAFLVGDSGSGKSLIAFQAAQSLLQDDWEVVKLRAGSIAAPRPFPHRTLMIVDDAQTLPANSVRSLFQATSQHSAVLMVSTDDIAGFNATVRVAARRSVSIIAEWMRKNSELVQRLVSALDDDVGVGYYQTSIERRIDKAESEAETPWNFTFVLTGGWRRARQELAVLREENDADLVLFAVAVGQLITADAGMPEDVVSSILSEVGLSASDYQRAYAKLRAQKLLSGKTRLKCPHLQYATVVVEQLCSAASSDRWDVTTKIIEAVFDSAERKMQGCNWLLQSLNYSDCFRWTDHRTAMNERTKAWISKSIWKASGPEDVRAGLFTLYNLKGWLPELSEQIEANLSTIARFVTTVDEVTAHAVAYFVNWFSQEDEQASTRLFDDVSARSVAGRVEAMTAETAYPYANLIGRLVNCAPKSWIREFRKHLPWKHIESLIERAQPKDVFALTELIHPLIADASKRETKSIRLLIPKLADKVNEDPVDASVNVDYSCWLILSLARFRPFWALVSPDSFATAISNGAPRDWHSLQVPLVCFHHGHSSRSKAISPKIDYDALLVSSRRTSDDRQWELVTILHYLAMYSDPRPVKRWMKSKSGSFLFPSRELAILLPERVAELIQGGDVVTLRMDGGFWGLELTTKCLRALASVDPEVARKAVKQNIEPLAEAISFDLKSYSTEGIEAFIEVVRELGDDLIREAIQSLDIAYLQGNWQQVLDGSDDSLKRTVTVLQNISS